MNNNQSLNNRISQYHSAPQKLVVGDSKMRHFLRGGLSYGRYSYWTGRVHNFRTGTLLNLIVSAVVNNPPPAGERYHVRYITTEGSADILSRAFADLFSKYLPSDPWTSESHGDYLARITAKLGWELSISVVDPMHPEELIHLIKNQALGLGVTPRLICVDTFENFQDDRRRFLKYLDQLAAAVPLTCHLALARLIGQDASWLARLAIDPTDYLRILARTGYVPKFDGVNAKPEYSIVHGVLRELGSNCFASYHHANENFDLGFVNMQFEDGNAWPR